MDRALSLEQAEERVALGEHHIRRQHEIIAKLERGGHDTALAKEVLTSLEMMQTSHLTSRERLLKAVGRDDGQAKTRDKE